jgi:hypothetical protein
MPSRRGLQSFALGGLAVLLCAAAPLEKAPAGKPVEHNRQDEKRAQPTAKQDQAKAIPSPSLSKANGPTASDQGAKAASSKKGSEGPKWTDIAQAFSAVVVMVFTAFLSWLSWRQHKLEERLAADNGESIDIAKQSADAARKAAEASTTQSETAAESLSILKAQLRAYVGLTRVNISLSKDGAKIKMTLKNTGATPAHEARLVASVELLPIPLVTPPHNLLADEAVSVVTLASGMEMYPIIDMERAITDDEWKQFRSGELGLYVSGFCTYKDFLQRPQETHFRLLHDKSHDTGAASPCGEGNYAT